MAAAAARSGATTRNTTKGGGIMSLRRFDSLVGLLIAGLLSPALGFPGRAAPVSHVRARTALWLAPSSGGDRRGAAAPPAPPANVRILILPGFGNDTGDYTELRFPTETRMEGLDPSGATGATAAMNTEGSLVANLRRRGWGPDQVRVLPLRRTDWLQVFLRGLVDVRFWAGTLPPTAPAFAWYLRRIADEVRDLCQSNDSSAEPSDTRVVLLCHSAGGWLARAALGFGSRAAAAAAAMEGTDRHAEDDTRPLALDLRCVLGMVTLGSPHRPPPPAVMDMTRGALRTTDAAFPGAYHRDDGTEGGNDGLFYLTVAGDAIRGAPPTLEEETATALASPFPWQRRRRRSGPPTPESFAYDSYRVVCGDGTALGDGVVPTCAAHLEGATQLTLPGVLHSVNTPFRWYGGDTVMDAWHDEMLRAINQRLNRPAKAKETPSSPLAALGRLLQR